jgi:transcriptional regulator with XRE-family HTH domain
VTETADAVAERLSVRIRDLRLNSGLTQAQLAARAGVTVETVARLERIVRGRVSAASNPSLATLVALASALGVDVINLFLDPRDTPPRGRKQNRK